ncbi:hypothetical protein CHL67_11740 [Prosthecochloris sp. GSB1]|uniref:NYN domain-containing protein n=1 Tax=Prosthecochloris sp. GSB1 TaxID=281093 RepID=UPI000B8C8B41|nr:NYN domain-containing protein [Prosthecochloris sp. GSB1]ASQ91508.1 hypothetical protein CHL67_11740 [Prosthecochloris sp. GSB1]
MGMGARHREIIIDAYNLLHKLRPAGSRDSLRHRREEMESLLLSFRQSSGQKITLVYDGSHKHGPCREAGDLDRVFTTRNRTADDWIIGYLKSLGRNTQMFTIVSSDRLIRMHATALGALCMPSEVFAETLLGREDWNVPAPAGREPEEKCGGKALGDKEIARWMKTFGT